jgi:hypothetical protein
MWVTIDVNDSQWGSWGNTSGGDTWHACPGQGATGVYAKNPDGSNAYPVYNYNVGYGVSSQDASPAGYTRAEGYENCGEQGKMIYWRANGVGANTDFARSFTINLTGQEGQVCVRENVSVIYSSDTHIFPTSDRANIDGAPADITASLPRVAKQSQRHCFYAEDDHPGPSTGSIACNPSIYSGTKGFHISGYDPDHASNTVRFEVIHANGAGYTQDIYSTTSKNGGNYPFTWIANRTYILKVYDIDNQQPYTITSIDSNTCSGGSTAVANGQCVTTFVQDETTHPVTFPNGVTANFNTNTFVRVRDDYNRSLIGAGNSTAPDGRGQYQIGNGQSKTFNYYPEQTPNVYIQVIRQYHNTIDNKWYTYSDSGPVKHVCFVATCSIDIISSRPDGIILENTPVWAHIVLDNFPRDGSYPDKLPLPAAMNSHNLSLTTNGGVENDVGAVDLGGSGEVYVPINADPTLATQTVSAYPDFYGYGSIGATAPGYSPDCSASFTVYHYFEVKPSAVILSADPENPTGPGAIQYQTCGNKITGPDVTAQDHTWLSEDTNGANAQDQGTVARVYGNNVCNTYTYSPPTVIPGNSYCANITITNAKGYVDAAGNVIDGTPDSAKSTCLTITNRPYVHFKGSDVFAGGGFGDNCVTTGGYINAYTKTTGAQAAGSGSQFGALALQQIFGFNSANLRTTFPTASKDLTFANNVAAPAMGGNLGLASHCVTDYFGKMPTAVKAAGPNTTATTANVGVDGAQYYKPPGSGTLTLNAGTIPAGVNQAIYVEGNVYITGGNITYQNSGGYGSIANVPSLMVIVKGGNIYIDPSVTQLDGVFVAEPTSGSNGDINTCSGATPIPLTAIFDNCKQRLVVNGALVANRVQFYRTYSSLRNSLNGENDVNTGAHICGTPGIDVPGGGPVSNSDCAAEVINFNPELFLSLPAIQAESGPAKNQYDYMTSLPPVL